VVAIATVATWRSVSQKTGPYDIYRILPNLPKATSTDALMA